jgi:hypothetical protein
MSAFFISDARITCSGWFGSCHRSPNFIILRLRCRSRYVVLLIYIFELLTFGSLRCAVSLCRAGCGVSRDGVKFDFDEDEEVGNKHHADSQSVDAVSRIGATSIGEVSLSVASHLGVGSSNASSAVRESTTALAGSING